MEQSCDNRQGNCHLLQHVMEGADLMTRLCKASSVNDRLRYLRHAKPALSRVSRTSNHEGQENNTAAHPVRVHCRYLEPVRRALTRQSTTIIHHNSDLVAQRAHGNSFGQNRRGGVRDTKLSTSAP